MELSAGSNRIHASSGQPRCHVGGLRRFALMILAIASLFSWGCRTYNVQTDWDPEVDFPTFQRYHFVDPPQVEGTDPFADNSLLRKRVRLSVENVLAERGFSKAAERDQADFLVTYSVVLDEELRVDGISSGVGIGGYNRRGIGFGQVLSSSNVRSYQESTLVVDFLQPATSQLVWRGWGKGIVGTRDRDRGLERMEAGVRAILDEFPPDRTSR